MKLPTQKKVLREDMKESPGWIVPLINVVNSFMENTYQALNKNITLRENIACFVKEITYTTPSTYPSGVENVQFKSELKTKATGLMVMQVVDKSNYTPALGSVYVPWIEDNGTIIIYPITGLDADKTYTIRLLIV